MLSITGIKTHYYEGTSIIQSAADIIQKSIRVTAWVRGILLRDIWYEHTWDGHSVRRVVASTRYRSLQAMEPVFLSSKVRHSPTPQSDLNLCPFCLEPCKKLDVQYLRLFLHFVSFFYISDLCFITNIFQQCLPWRHWLIFDGGGRLNQIVVHWTRLIDLFIYCRLIGQLLWFQIS